ncbi:MULTISPECIES: hypothetical protein [Flavobacterium]|uniref:HTH merR-type domain-containing protein n=1 Tax=Flavobacterium keumense TaxID=1306518 RepID=A0ABY8N3C8_9FLAO|nr:MULTISPECIES: hypothetical protein [Flavobacterium]WGK93764.1 hypothetical protein MG292_06585 [Flavobacterium keumense]
MEPEKLKVVTTNKACELLECSRNHFHRKYRSKLKVYKSENGFNTYYSLYQIEKLIEQEKIKKNNVVLKDEIEIIG